MWCREIVLKCVKASVIGAMEKMAAKELSEDIDACSKILERETDWKCPESKAEATTRKAKEKAEKGLWKNPDDLTRKL